MTVADTPFPPRPLLLDVILRSSRDKTRVRKDGLDHATKTYEGHGEGEVVYGKDSSRSANVRVK